MLASTPCASRRSSLSCFTTAITYGAIGGWYYKAVPTDGSPSSMLLIFFCTMNQAWFMGPFFLLAGCYTPAALQAKGFWRYLRDRLQGF